MMRRTLSLLVLVAVLGACASDDTPVAPLIPACGDITLPAVETLRWKRVGAFVTDLGRALELQDDALCTELGLLSCVDLHRMPLGGADPFGAAIYTPPAAPMNTTPMLVERVALAACSNRAAADAVGNPVVFKQIDLASTSLSSSDAGVLAQVDELYHRLLSRDASEQERAVVASLADGNTGQDFAALACFTIATTTEFLFF